MSSYCILYHGPEIWLAYTSARIAGELKYCNSLDVFNKTIIPLVLVGYEIVIANLYPVRAGGIIVTCKY